jgi:MFS family permease
MILHHNFHYFTKDVNREVKEVYWFAAINALALSLTYIFEPIYLFNLGYSVIDILWFYVQVYIWYAILVFPAAKLAGRIGYKHSILLSSAMYVGYWVVLYQISNVSALFFVAPILFALQKSLFWPAYNSDIALNSQKQQRGRVVGVLLSVIEGVSIIGPLLGGIISSQFGFATLFSAAAILMVAASYPLFRSPDIYTKHRFKFANFIKIFKKHKSNFFGYWGYAEDLMLMSLWPLLIFVAVPTFMGVGGIATFASLSASVLMLWIGRLTDKASKHQLIRFASAIYGLTWIFRFLGRTIPSLMFFDVLTKTAKASVNVPMLSLTFELAGSKDADHAIAYAVFYEFAIAVAKILMALAGIAILFTTGNVYLVFALAGVMTLFYGFLKK